ncbi:DNA-binding response regulator [Mucilaginibacter sp. PPCGB 2223]|uniref:response regulator n=1 Tax=Mucilaginibacter sp. PPCGB 2223 TaxID=1886027 RepID=UPI000826DE84|nr:response regulator transcription factor [Mucilaginibacter sp. PPCGB 2223]OCX52022.1 DNA-binding response regulator [Mucilaginibacter sp. PPCGB 2223]
MKISIAIADDQELIIQGLAMMLEKRPDMEIVFKSQGGANLIKGLAEYTPDILLLDIQMPDANGIDLCKEVTKTVPHIKVIALTNFEEMHYVKQMLRNGAKGYLLKNTDQETLVKAIIEVNQGKLFLDAHIHETMIGELAYGRNRPGVPVHLTKREKEILKLIAEENSNQQIADKLFLSLRTVETHRLNLMQKLSVKNSIGLVKEAIKRGLL